MSFDSNILCHHHAHVLSMDWISSLCKIKAVKLAYNPVLGNHLEKCFLFKLKK